MRLNRIRQLATLVVLVMLHCNVQAADYAPEVFRSDAISIQAGITSANSQIAHFGDLLNLVVVVTYDPGRIVISEIDSTMFTSAWSSVPGVTLASWNQQAGSTAGDKRRYVHTNFIFQVLGCPDDDLPTCPGDREYPLPQFEVAFDDRPGTGDAPQLVRFTPWPQLLRIASTMQRDEEGQLYSFETYFPAGGYPEPMDGRDGTMSAVITAGTALAVLTGGLIMWPFRNRRSDSATAAEPRWQRQLRLVRETGDVDDVRFVDAMRRCLVWFCNDELGIDPFVWLDLAESSDDEAEESSAARNHAQLRRLFFELLHDPVGQGAELRTRLESVIGQEGAGRA